MTEQDFKGKIYDMLCELDDGIGSPENVFFEVLSDRDQFAIGFMKWREARYIYLLFFAEKIVNAYISVEDNDKLYRSDSIIGVQFLSLDELLDLYKQSLTKTDKG